MDESPTSCTIKPTERVSLSDARLRDCLLAPGTRITIHYNRPQEVRPMRKAKHREAAPAPEPADEPAEVPTPDDHAAAPAVVAPQVATVGAPTTATDELSRLLPAHGEVGGVSLVLAVVAVLGGGAAWKFYSQRSREQHELAMRELELRAAGGQGQSSECKADSAALRDQVAQLDGRLSQVEGRQGDLVLPSVPDDLEERLARLEAASKPAPARRSSKATGGK